MKIKKKYIIIILAFIFAYAHANCQTNREQVVLAYLNNFVKYTDWPNESIKDTFQIAVLSQNKKQIEEFLAFSKKRTLKNKPVQVTVIKEKSALSKFQLIFISQENRNFLPEIYSKIDGKPILLVSENYTDKRFVMINLYDTRDKVLQFEINKVNILNQHLEIDPEVLLAGGTEIDVVKLYRSSQLNLLKMKADMDVMQDSMKKLAKEANSTLVQIIKQKDEILEQNTKLIKRSKELDSLKDILKINNAVLKLRKDSIARKNKVLDGQYEKIQYQWEEINKQENLLIDKQSKIEDLNREIEKKNNTLENQSDRINRQQQLLYLSIVIVFLILILVINISISYKKNKEKRIRLAKQKKEIEWQLIELKVLNNKLKNSDKYKSIFLASMSHELRTPLNSIIGYSGILLMGMTGDLNGEQKKQLEKVKRNAQHLLSLINDILDISKIEAGKVELHKELFKIEDIVKEVVEIIEPRANEKNLELSIHFEPNLEVFSDKRRVMQVVLNLVSNAVNYTDVGKVHITTEIKKNNLFRLSVIDTGIGISDEDKLRLFQPFQQIDSSLTKQKGGTGLGLYLCRKLMQMIGGTINVESEPGKGSVFYFEMPINKSEDEKSTNN